MTLQLPRPIEVFFTSENAHDVLPLDDCMAPDAVVIDEQTTRRGLAEIRSWRVETGRKYAHRIEPIASEQRDGAIKVRCRVTGNFPGSPIELDYNFGIEGGRIATLEIG